jgi:NAD(P)-dependent dehydrogenase (short-subunit alcohol dehydrogenase family)
MITALVVGCDRGIAHAVARQLHERGEHVIAACLGSGDDLKQMGLVVEPYIDVTSGTDAADLAARLAAAGTELDWLLHVAGVLGLDQLGSIDYADVQRQFEINSIGPLRTVEALRGRLRDGSKVGIVTSRVGSLSDNGSGGMFAYRMSKAAANMAGLNLHHALSPRGISVLMLHPGMVATDMTRDFPGDFAYIQPDEAAAGLIRCMDRLTPATSGRFQHADGSFLPW